MSKSRSKVTAAHRTAAHKGAVIGREAIGDLNAVIHRARAQCAGDPVALAAMTTVILHGLVDNGRRGALSGDSLAAALQDERHRAISRLDLGPTELAEVLPGIRRVRAGQLIAAAGRALSTPNSVAA